MTQAGEDGPLRLSIRGRVQGVGFRAWLAREARSLGVRGWVRNRPDGSVEAVVAGPRAGVTRLVDACRRGPALARVVSLDTEPAPGERPGEQFEQRPTG